MTETNEVPEPTQGTGDAGSPQPAPGDAVNAPDQGDRETNKDARMWGMFCHLAGLAGFVLPAFGCVVGPLVVWLIKKDEFPFVDEQGKEALNFQITMFIYGIAVGLLCFVCIGLILAPALGIAYLVFMILAAVKANDGYHYRYPKYLIFRLIK